MESEIIAAQEAGAKREPGSPVALVSIEQRRVPKWEDEFIAVASKDAANTVIERTIPSITKKLVIS